MNSENHNDLPPRVALSIRQPWAWLIVNGYKDVENRSWSTDFRGKFLVHAGWIFDEEGYHRAVKKLDIDLPEPDDYERGGIVGVAEIYDCVTQSDSPWFEGKYGFLLKNARSLPFVAMKGKRMFFSIGESK